MFGRDSVFGSWGGGLEVCGVCVYLRVCSEKGSVFGRGEVTVCMEVGGEGVVCLEGRSVFGSGRGECV